MLRLRLHGPLTADLDGVRLALPTSERARALIAWLSLHPGPHPRTEVAARLWPDVAPDNARASLRTAVWAVRRAWAPAAAELLVVDRTSIGLAADELWVDTLDADPPGPDPAQLLPGLADDWVEEVRTRLDEQRVERLARLADAAEHAGDLDTAIRHTRTLSALRPLDESAHRSLVARLVDAGQQAEAVVAAREFADLLQREVGVPPSPATREVHARATAGGPAASAPALFGRAEEVRTLRERWRAAAAGRGEVVVLGGEAGIGKTTLALQLARRAAAAGARTAFAAGVDVAGETPFTTWLQVAEDLTADARPVPSASAWPVELNRLSPGLGARLGHAGAPPSAAAPELERLRVFEALIRLVEWVCADRPLLIVIDDADRVDRASLRLTSYVARRLAGLPVLVVLTRREGVRRPELDELVADLSRHAVPVTTLDLAPIGERDVAALARSLHPFDDSQIGSVVSAAEGNPLLAVETARALVAGSAGPPPNLRAAVDAIVGRLPADVVEAVELLAVAGRGLRPAELRRLGGSAVGNLVEATEGLLVRRADRLGFRHELLRAAVLARVGDPPALHDRLASAVEPEELTEVAHHLAAAGRPQDAAAAWAAAAERARTMGALEEAGDLLERATRDAPGDPRWWLQRVELMAWQGRRAELEAAWETALPLVADDQLAATWSRRGRLFRSVECNPTESRRCYLTARQLLGRATVPEVRAEVLIGLAWSDAVAGSGGEFESLLRDAEAVVADLGPRARIDVLETRMQGLIRQGRFADAADLVDADALVRTPAPPERTYPVLANAVCALLRADRDEEALELVAGAHGPAGDFGVMAVKNLSTRALILARLGRHREAAAAAEDARERCQRLDTSWIAATTDHDAGLVALMAGRYADAADLLGRALANGADVSRVSAGLARAEALAASGDPVAATGQLRAALTETVGPADQPWALVPRVAWVQALIAEATGDPALARRRLDEAEQGWRRLIGLASSTVGESYSAALVDLGRPPIVGLVEPERELARIAAARSRLGSLAPPEMEVG